MRIDKFLKETRIVKRRVMANEACDSGKVSINGRVVKAGTQVKAGDEITLDFNYRIIKIVVTDEIDAVKRKRDAVLYQLISDERTQRRDQEDSYGG